jgi:hypothetical protein
MSVVIGAASEVRSYEILQCSGDCGPIDRSLFPKTVTAAGAHFRLGYDWEDFGFQFGAVGWGTVGADVVPGAGTKVLPEACLRFGPSDARFELGLGSYGASTVLRPGIYAGFGMVPTPGWNLIGHLGFHLPMGAPKADLVTRGEVEIRGPVSQTVQLGLGTALSSGYRSAEPEAHALVSTVF